jgi:hypothetical protein
MTEPACGVCGKRQVEPGGRVCRGCLRGLLGDAPGASVLCGDYELLDPSEPMGEGATAFVHLARQRVSGEMVALKLPKPGISGELFLRQARTESVLRHPNIVRAQLGPTHDGAPTLVMPLMEGGKLSQHALRRAPLERRREAALQVVRAVQAAHEVGIVHSDIKADNVLIDEHGEAHLADFGLARALAPSGDRPVIGGTRGWMAPEQVRALRRREAADPPTTATDVFTLGVLIHWLVTGSLPFGKGNDFEARVLGAEPPPLPRFAPGLRWQLLAIAHRAMKWEPRDRYESAAAMAEDLTRLVDHRPLLGVTVPTVGRAFRWSQRHPGVRNTAFVLLPCFATGALLLAGRQSEELKQEALAMNAYAARGQAALVLYRLRDHADRLARATRDPAVRALAFPEPGVVRAGGGGAPERNPCGDQTRLADATPLVRFSRGFSTVAVIDKHGCPRARLSEEPPTAEYIRGAYAWRDYFASARSQAMRASGSPGVRLSYRSIVSQLVKFAISAPLFEGAGDPDPARFIGMINGSVTVSSALDLPGIHQNEHRDRLTAVVGPFEGATPGDPDAPQRELTFLYHRRLARGAKVVLPQDVALELRTRFGAASTEEAEFALPTAAPLLLTDYRDPWLGGGWLAAFAPVGGTGHIVVVQSTVASAERTSRLLRQLGLALALAWLVALGAWSALAGWARRSARSDP